MPYIARRYWRYIAYIVKLKFIVIYNSKFNLFLFVLFCFVLFIKQDQPHVSGLYLWTQFACYSLFKKQFKVNTFVTDISNLLKNESIQVSAISLL